MLTTAARNAPRARALQARRSLRSKPLSPSSAARLGYAHQQCRGFRFGPWGSDTDPDLHREFRRRHRMFRYRYMESFTRKISWENSPGSGDPKAALKAAITQSAKSSDRPAGQFDKVDSVKSWSEGSSNLRSGKKVKDGERDPVDQLFETKTAPYEYDLWKSPLRNIRKYLEAERSPKEVTPEEVLHATTTAEEDSSFIDPITNRKVHQSTTASPETGKKTSFTPKYEDLDGDASGKAAKATRGEGKHGPVRWNEPDGRRKPTAEEESKNYKDLDKYKPKMDNPNAPRKLTPEEKSKQYKDLGDYKPVRWNEPDGLQKPSQEEKSKQYNDLDKYKPVQWNEPDGLQKPTAEEQSKKYNDLSKYGAIRWNEPDGLLRLTPEERSKEYEDLEKYGPVRWSEPDGLPQTTPEEKSKEYEDLDKYGPVRWNEPDGLQEATPEEKSKNYDDLSSYGAVRWNEPDGLQKPTPEEQSKNYDDLDEYGAVRWNEPDGLRKLTPEEESKKYEDLDNYSEGFIAKDSALEAQEASQLDPTPRGQPLPSKVDVVSEDPGKEYDDLDKYGPVRWNEPDGLRMLTPEELSKNYDDLHKYGPVKWNEPDGLRVLTPEELSKLYADLSKYSQASAPIGPEVVSPARIHPEEASKNYNDLNKYDPTQFDSPDRKYPIHPEEASKAYKDLNKYDPQVFDSPDRAYPMHPEQASKAYKDLNKYDPKQFDSPDQAYPMHPEEATKAYKDLNSYEPKKFDSPDKAYPVHPEEASKAYKDLNKYEPKKFDSPDQKYPMHPEEATKAYKDLGKYKSVPQNEPNGEPSEQPDARLESLDRKTNSRPDSAASREQRGRRNRFFSDFNETPIDVVDSLTAQDIRAEVLRKVRDNSQKQKLEEAKAEHDLSWDATTKEAQDAVSGRKLTGNYTRDFPEEFTRSWSTANSQSKSALYPKDLAEASTGYIEEDAQGTERDEVEMSSMDESFPSLKTRLETTMDQGAATRVPALDPYSKAPKGLETSYNEECKDAFRPVVVKHYGAIPTKQSPTAAPASEKASVYKVLAYDPNLQTINIAETTSVVHDATPASTPAEVLLRLSSPSKFLPHFGPLQDEGYEIISGSGDVLVFRKVRAASATKGTSSSTHTSASRVNPVDMMGKPVTGNFASPTGFVNYNELSEGSVEKPEPPFRSNIDVRREESVFSGRRQGGEKSKKKKSFGRKMVMGTVWVAGTAYAVGVLGEYFATGGMDGSGPKGL